MEPFAQRYSQSRAIQALENGYVTIFAGGTGNPFFTTDSAAALRALEINADILLKGTNVDGVYDKDPKLYPDAKKFDKLSFQTAIEKQLHVMDITAFAMCAENNLPIIVFNIHEKGNLLKIINGEKIGTLVC
jgi:uridylate kinase